MRNILMLAGALLLAAPAAQAQDMVTMLGQKIVQKYTSTSCADLIAKKANPAPPSPMETRVIAALKADPAKRQEFINLIAGPIANKMFDCGMIP